MKKKNSFVVIGGKWFDKVNGNTYHNAKIIDYAGNVYYTGFAYGYGTQYLENARKYIVNELKIKNPEIINGGDFYTLKRDVKNGNF